MIADILLFCGIVFVVFVFRTRSRNYRLRRAKSRLRHVLVDGSNVMFWDGEIPKVETIIQVIGVLRDKGFQANVIFDANVGYKLSGRYQGEREMARLLRLPPKSVMVVPKGTPADEYLLIAARQSGVPIVTNDRYRDWASRFPEVETPGYLLRGEVKLGKVWVDTA